MSNDRIQQIHNSINRIVHEPVRLAILKTLCSAKEVDFNFLLTILGVTKGNLASHIEKLQTAGYLSVKKEFRGKMPHTTYRVTPAGRREFRRYWNNMKELAPER